MEWARLGSNQQLLACETSALPLSYSPMVWQLRDKESNPDLHVQSVVSCRLDDPGTDDGRGGRRPLRPAPAQRKLDAAARALFGDRRCHSMSRPRGVSALRTMFSMPLAYPSTLDRRSPFAHSAAVVVLRGGALEPDAQVRIGKSHAKANAICIRVIPAR